MVKLLIKGAGAGGGIVKGRVRIVMTPKEASRLKNKEILVAPATSPLFTSAILKAKAIVTDTGGVLCHTAIIARELNIPCVVGTRNATKILKDGQEVVVDGKEGTVYHE